MLDQRVELNQEIQAKGCRAARVAFESGECDAAQESESCKPARLFVAPVHLMFSSFGVLFRGRGTTLRTLVQRVSPLLHGLSLGFAADTWPRRLLNGWGAVHAMAVENRLSKEINDMARVWISTSKPDCSSNFGNQRRRREGFFVQRRAKVGGLGGNCVWAGPRARQSRSTSPQTVCSSPLVESSDPPEFLGHRLRTWMTRAAVKR